MEESPLEAPIYAPAQAYRPPTPAPAQLRVSNVSLAELKSAPQAWAVVVKHVPAFAQLVRTPVLKPYLENMQVESFITFSGLLDEKTAQLIDEELRALPRSAWPAL
jgi:hypothetical protein